MFLARNAATRDPSMDPSDVLFEVREAVRRITRRTAVLYGPLA
jgi:hypothetical protein